MRKNRSQLAISLIIAFVITSLQYKSYAQENDIQGTWSGTVRMKQVYTGELGTSTLEIMTTFNENRGSGTMKFEGEFKIGNTTQKVTCNGSGIAELYHLNIAKDDDSVDIYSYYIHVIGPDFNCSPADGGPGTDGRDIAFGDRVTGNHRNALNGIQTHTVDNGAGKVTTTFSWDLQQKPPDVELIVTPRGTDISGAQKSYDDWLPEPGWDEFSKGSVMNISLKLQGKNGKPLQQKAKRFEIRLVNTSREPGITINYPLNPVNPTFPDLRFLIQPNAAIEDEFQTMKISCNNCTTADLKIGSYDGGGYTTLIATAILEDDITRIDGNLLVSGGITEIPIPKRNGSMIGEKWWKDNDNPGDYDDKETSDGNNNPGDGLTAYEEYRGVRSEGDFKRLDPKKKELGVMMQRSSFGQFAEGIKWFENSSDIKVIRFYIHEIEADRKFNRNHSQGHIYDQFVLYLLKGNLPNNKAGKAFTIDDNPNIPANTTRVVIATDNIRQNYQLWLGWARANNLQLRWTESEYLANTVAHEMGHGVNVWHHGNNDNADQNETAPQGSSPVYHIFDRSGVEITTRPYTIPSDNHVCPALGSQTSGDLHCVMAYIDVCDWARFAYADGSIGLFQSPLLAVGRTFCRKKDGTEINAGSHNVGGVSYNNYFGRAENGECLSKIKLK